MNKKLSKQIKFLPQEPGIYMFLDKSGRILYVGKAIKLKNRVRSHFVKNNNLYKGDLIKNITNIDWIETKNEKQALILEDKLIKKYQPRYNIQWRDDKSYFWVSFSNDEWPRVKIVHKPSLRPRHLEENNPVENDKNSRLLRRSAPRNDNVVGPFVNGTELKQVLRALRKITPFRTCKNSYQKPCLQWHLGLCPAHRSFNEDVSVYDNNKSHTFNHLSQKNPPHPSFAKEGGAVFFQKTARVDLEKYKKTLNTLQQILRLYAGEKIRIEAYDISNIQGTNATGSMIVFEGNKPKKSDYRRFRIKTIPGADDTAMLKEVLHRRFAHKEWPLPDLILIDGGKAQLNAAQLIIKNYKLKTNLMSLAKKEEELYTIYSQKVLSLKILPFSLRLNFQAIRNEAHRFAISYYRYLHAQRFRKTSKKSREKSSTSR
jgi:excinuclease ABC subunit C